MRSKSARPSRGSSTVVPSAPRTRQPGERLGRERIDGVERAGQVRGEHREVVVRLRDRQPREGSLVGRGPLGQQRGLAGPGRARDEDDRRPGAEPIDERGPGDEAGPDLGDPQLGVERGERAQAPARACARADAAERVGDACSPAARVLPGC